MATKPSKMKMEIDMKIGSNEDYLLNLIRIVRSKYQICVHDVISKDMIKASNRICKSRYKNSIEDDKFEYYRYKIIDLLSPIFEIQPQFKTICEYKHELVRSCFTKFNFLTSEDVDSETLNDSKLVIDYCGYHLTELNIRRHPHSDIMPLIRDNCPSLRRLSLEFDVLEDKDFENALSKMFHLKYLIIRWQCEKSLFPLNLVKSLEQVGGSLRDLYIESKNNALLPDLLASVFRKLTAIKCLCVYGSRLSESLIQSLDELENLDNLHIGFPLADGNLVIDEQINMYPTDLKNLEFLRSGKEYNFTDESFIHLCKNSKKLRDMRIVGKNITDDGMLALNNLSQLKYFNLGLKCFGEETSGINNDFITDQSVTNLSIGTLRSLNISNCIKISNESVIKLVENLDNLSILYIENTMVNIEVIKELSKLKKRSSYLIIWVSFNDSNGYFNSLSESHNIHFRTEH